MTAMQHTITVICYAVYEQDSWRTKDGVQATLLRYVSQRQMHFPVFVAITKLIVRVTEKVAAEKLIGFQ